MLFEARHAEVEAQRKLLALQRDLARTQAQLAFKPIRRRRRAMNRIAPPLCRRRRRRAASPAASTWAAHAASRHDTMPAAAAARPRRPSARCCTGTTRWCRASASTSPASRRSWTCSCVPVYADEAQRLRREGQPAASSRTSASAPATVKRAEVSARRSTRSARVQFDERLSVAVQTRVAGYVERLSVRAPMERVAKGQALATVFAPDWLGPLNELVALKRARRLGRAAGGGARAHPRDVDSGRAGAPGRGRRARRRRATRCSRRRAAWSPSWACARAWRCRRA